MSNILTSLSNKYLCDKSDKRHGYTKYYHRFFEKYRNERFNMIEFGFGVGKSTKMWLEYFKKAKLITVDIRPLIKDKKITEYIKTDRFEYINASQCDEDLLLEVFNKYKEFFIMIDDASHVPEDQQFTLGFSFPYVSKGGWYIIEDLKCKRSHSELFPTQADKTLFVLNEYLDTKKFNSKVLTEEQNFYITDNIEHLEIHDKIAFIIKRGLYGRY